MSQTMEKEIRRLEKEIWKLAGSEFNVNSPTQLAEILFDKLNLQPNARRGKAKARSTAADILEELSAPTSASAKIIEYREIAKLKSTYVDALPKLIHSETGRLHTSFSQTGTATGRLSSSDPNLQNISDPERAGPRDSRCFSSRERKDTAVCGLLADRAAHHGAFFERPRARRSFPATVKTSTRDGAGSFRRRAARTKPRSTAAPPRPSLRHHLRPFAVRASAQQLASSRKKPRNSSTPISRVIAA